jgi:hypothetical protein
MLLIVQKSFIYTEIDIYYVNSYIQYIIELLKIIIIKHNLNINIILGNSNYGFNNNNKTLKMNINWEHTLVKKNGRDVMPNCLQGKVLTNTGDPYLVRIERYEELINSDIVIDYSIPNIYNIYTSNQYNILFNKLIYISPTLFEYNFLNYNTKQRQINVLTTFINTNEPRRQKLLENIKLANIDHKNINNCFGNDELKNLYLSTKILINIHQTNDHHTFEELRVLPALLTGVIVISEVSPVNKLIPYNDLIIWTSYNNIIETINKVNNNYDYYYNKIFKSKDILSNLHKNNIEKIENKLLF